MKAWNGVLDACAREPEFLIRAVNEIPEKLLDQSVDNEKWSIREIFCIHHFS